MSNLVLSDFDFMDREFIKWAREQMPESEIKAIFKMEAMPENQAVYSAWETSWELRERAYKNRDSLILGSLKRFANLYGVTSWSKSKPEIDAIVRELEANPR